MPNPGTDSTTGENATTETGSGDRSSFGWWSLLLVATLAYGVKQWQGLAGHPKMCSPLQLLSARGLVFTRADI
ncbi:hypothetical protein [Motilimonas pumila]|uniref:Uncharacterized protein n=1 Tax=Motilimonas pumila TaxID=2303987 RepID=A0A418YIK8_9GAMM|nr:hypothetical protein [Motilimonas pumila]RJG50485.1 hypothetical protein D1Z90_03120 [Motilimonas pumila]